MKIMRRKVGVHYEDDKIAWLPKWQTEPFTQQILRQLQGEPKVVLARARRNWGDHNVPDLLDIACEIECNTDSNNIYGNAVLPNPRAPHDADELGEQLGAKRRCEVTAKSRKPKKRECLRERIIELFGSPLDDVEVPKRKKLTMGSRRHTLPVSIAVDDDFLKPLKVAQKRKSVCSDALRQDKVQKVSVVVEILETHFSRASDLVVPPIFSERAKVTVSYSELESARVMSPPRLNNARGTEDADVIDLTEEDEIATLNFDGVQVTFERKDDSPLNLSMPLLSPKAVEPKVETTQRPPPMEVDYNNWTSTYRATAMKLPNELEIVPISHQQAQNEKTKSEDSYPVPSVDDQKMDDLQSSIEVFPIFATQRRDLETPNSLPLQTALMQLGREQNEAELKHKQSRRQSRDNQQENIQKRASATERRQNTDSSVPRQQHSPNDQQMDFEVSFAQPVTCPRRCGPVERRNSTTEKRQSTDNQQMNVEVPNVERQQTTVERRQSTDKQQVQIQSTPPGRQQSAADRQLSTENPTPHQSSNANQSETRPNTDNQNMDVESSLIQHWAIRIDTEEARQPDTNSNRQMNVEVSVPQQSTLQRQLSSDNQQMSVSFRQPSVVAQLQKQHSVTRQGGGNQQTKNVEASSPQEKRHSSNNQSSRNMDITFRQPSAVAQLQRQTSAEKLQNCDNQQTNVRLPFPQPSYLTQLLRHQSGSVTVQWPQNNPMVSLQQMGTNQQRQQDIPVPQRTDTVPLQVQQSHREPCQQPQVAPRLPPQNQVVPNQSLGGCGYVRPQDPPAYEWTVHHRPLAPQNVLPELFRMVELPSREISMDDLVKLVVPHVSKYLKWHYELEQLMLKTQIIFHSTQVHEKHETMLKFNSDMLRVFSKSFIADLFRVNVKEFNFHELCMSSGKLVHITVFRACRVIFNLLRPSNLFVDTPFLKRFWHAAVSSYEKMKEKSGKVNPFTQNDILRLGGQIQQFHLINHWLRINYKVNNAAAAPHQKAGRRKKNTKQHNVNNNQSSNVNVQRHDSAQSGCPVAATSGQNQNVQRVQSHNLGVGIFDEVSRSNVPNTVQNTNRNNLREAPTAPSSNYLCEPQKANPVPNGLRTYSRKPSVAPVPQPQVGVRQACQQPTPPPTETVAVRKDLSPRTAPPHSLPLPEEIELRNLLDNLDKESATVQTKVPESVPGPQPECNNNDDSSNVSMEQEVEEEVSSSTMKDEAGEEVIDLTWIEDGDENEILEEVMEEKGFPMPFPFKVEDYEGGAHEARPREMVSPTDSGLGSPTVSDASVEAHFTCLCGKRALFICACSSSMYCSRDCQVRDWADHQKLCNRMQS